jgi:hypothetical protein
MQDAKNEVDEMNFFLMGLNSYNSYLRRKIKLQIKDLKKVYSKNCRGSNRTEKQYPRKICAVLLVR